MTIRFTAVLEKFDQMGEKSGWTYINIPAKVTQKLKPGYKRSFRVKGRIDEHPIEYLALLPMGDGNFIMAVNGSVRKAIRKNKGATVSLELSVDESCKPLLPELMDCLADEPAALAHFESMPPSHQQYYANWINSAKTEATRVKRLSLAVITLAKKMNYGEMLRFQKEEKGLF